MPSDHSGVSAIRTLAGGRDGLPVGIGGGAGKPFGSHRAAMGDLRRRFLPEYLSQLSKDQIPDPLQFADGGRFRNSLLYQQSIDRRSL